MKEMTCTVCPMSCQLIITKDPESPDGLKVEGGSCKRGRIHAIKELTNPTRLITSTVRIDGALIDRIPVRTDGEIPREKIFELMEIIRGLKVQAPVKRGDIIYKSVFDSDVNIIASRSMDKVN